MKKKFVTTPIKFYLIGLGLMCLFLIGWIVFSIIYSLHSDMKIYDEISNIFENSFFAFMGSLLIAILIDLGNTARDNNISAGALSQIKQPLESIYYIIAPISYVLTNAITINEKEEIKVDYYWNNEFYYSDESGKNRTINYITFENISLMKSKIKNFVNDIVTSISFVNINTELRDAIEKLYVNKFYMITELSKVVFQKNVTLCGLKNEIIDLQEIVNIISKFLDKNNAYKLMDEKEANKEHLERIQIYQDNKEIVDALSRGEKIYEGTKQL